MRGVSTFEIPKAENAPVNGPLKVRGHGNIMNQSKSSEELYSEQRRQRAAELIAAILRKRRRADTDESLLDQEALRTSAEQIVERKQA